MDPIPDDELLEMAVEFNMGAEPLLSGHPFWWLFFEDDVRRNSVTVKNMGNPDKGEDRFAIIGNFGCLNKLGEWEYQGMPSGRSEDFYERCRYSSVHEAINYYRLWRDVVEEYALRKYEAAGIEFKDGMPMEDYKKIVINYDEIPRETLTHEALLANGGRTAS